jgi:uncharacterized damage-inducible protein DinB
VREFDGSWSFAGQNVVITPDQSIDPKRFSGPDGSAKYNIDPDWLNTVEKKAEAGLSAGQLKEKDEERKKWELEQKEHQAAEAKKLSDEQVKISVLNNLKQLEQTADLYFMENDVTDGRTMTYDDLVGPGKYVRVLSLVPVDGEDYRTIKIQRNKPLYVTTARGLVVTNDPAVLADEEIKKKTEEMMSWRKTATEEDIVAAIRIHLTDLSQAANQFFNNHSAEPSYDDLRLLTPWAVVAVDGEDYRQIKIEHGKPLSVKRASGVEVTFDPNNR